MPVPMFPDIPPLPDNLKTAPLITLSLTKLLASDPSETEALFECSKGFGFFYLDLMGCPEGERLYGDAQALLKLQEQFFNLPDVEKAVCDRDIVPEYEGIYGYRKLGSRIIDKMGTRDRTELYNLKKDDVIGNTAPLPAPQLIKDNMPLYDSYVRNAHSVVLMMLSHINDSLGLPPNTLGNLHRLEAQSGDQVQFRRSPAGQGPSAGPHTDFGSLTILFNWLGGLQVQLPGEKEWVYVHPVPGCAIINLGDAMVKFTAGLLRSNLHRVISPPGEQANCMRYSLVYFSRPEDTVVLKRLKGGVIDAQPVTEGDDDAPTSKDWILRRGRANRATADWTPEKWKIGQGTEGDRIEVV